MWEHIRIRTDVRWWHAERYDRRAPPPRKRKFPIRHIDHAHVRSAGVRCPIEHPCALRWCARERFPELPIGIRIVRIVYEYAVPRRPRIRLWHYIRDAQTRKNDRRMQE